jgi:hypothetical protein
MVEARLNFSASVLKRLAYVRVLGGLGSSIWMVYGHVHYPRCVWAHLKYIVYYIGRMRLCLLSDHQCHYP